MTTSETLDQEDLVPEFPSMEDDERPQGDA
jgi:hypothetical protein